MALMPLQSARGVKAGQRLSLPRKVLWDRFPVTVASTQGPWPVAYWSASMAATTSSRGRHRYQPSLVVEGHTDPVRCADGGVGQRDHQTEALSTTSWAQG